MMQTVNPSGQLTLEQALTVLNELMLAKMGRTLSEPETTLVEGTWNDDDYKVIAEGTPYTVNYLKGHVAPQLWNILAAIVGTGKKVTKTNLRSFLEYLYQREYTCSGQTALDSLAIEPLKINGEPPDVSTFFGRSQELAHIKELISNYKLLSLIGIAGIGKTALAAKLLKQISNNSNPQFDLLIWKSVAHAPTVQELVTDLIQVIQDTHSPSPSPLLQYPQANITVLLQALQSRRCLIVLDEIDAFQTISFEQRLDYRLFFRRLIEEQHQSSFIVTSRTLISDIKTLLKAKRPLQYIKIKGLDSESAMQLLRASGLNGNKKCKELIEMYYGHPAELQSVVERINHYFAGSAETFFHNKTTFVSPEMQSVLNDIFTKELNQTQHRIMLSLASFTTDNPALVSFNQLLKNFPPILNKEISISELIEALECLENLSLIDTFKDSKSKELYLCLQPVIKKYIFINFLGVVTKSEPSQTISLAS